MDYYAQVRDILERERKEIQDQILAEIDTTEIVFMEQALRMLQEKEEKLNNQYEQPKIVELDHPEVPIVYQKQEVNQNKVDWFDVTEDGATCIETIQDQVEDLAVSFVQTNLNPDAPSFVMDELNDNQSEEFPLIDNALQEGPVVEQKIDNACSDIDKQNQAKYFYFYQGLSLNVYYVVLALAQIQLFILFYSRRRSTSVFEQPECSCSKCFVGRSRSCTPCHTRPCSAQRNTITRRTGNI